MSKNERRGVFQNVPSDYGPGESTRQFHGFHNRGPDTPGQATPPSFLSEPRRATSVPEKKTRLGSACESQWRFFFLANRKTIAYRSLHQAKDTKPPAPSEAIFNQVSLASRCLAQASLATASDAGLAFKV